MSRYIVMLKKAIPLFLWGAVLCVATPVLGATCYTNDGILSARLETERWLINRARFDPEREADRLGLTNALPGGHPNYDVCEDSLGTNDFGATTNEWASWIVPRPPLAPNAKLNTAASNHSKDLVETDTFQHTSPSSKYYPAGSSPAARHAREGYTNQITGYYENISSLGQGDSGGYPDEGGTPTEVHSNLFVDISIIDRGHRQSILNSIGREIGLGSTRTNFFSGGYYWTYDYDTQDFGTDSTNHFFTDTIFFDANTNGVYNEGEGVGGIEIRLWDGTNQATWYDVSGSSGSFAIPINSLADGHSIRVELTNTNAANRSLTLPLGYTTLAAVTLTNQETFVTGTYPQPAGITNIGFRDLAITTECRAITLSNTNATLSFSSLERVGYRLESNTNLLTTNWIPVATMTATNRTGQFTALSTTNSAQFFRVILLRDTP